MNIQPKRSGEPEEAPEEASRGSCEAPWRCFGSSWRFIKLPKPRSLIHSFVEEREGREERRGEGREERGDTREERGEERGESLKIKA